MTVLRARRRRKGTRRTTVEETPEGAGDAEGMGPGVEVVGMGWYFIAHRKEKQQTISFV